MDIDQEFSTDEILERDKWEESNKGEQGNYYEPERYEDIRGI